MLRALTCLTLLALPTLVRAAPASDRPTMVLMNGRCERLVIRGSDQTADCTGKVLNTIHRSGRVGFYFVTASGATLTFTGMGSAQVNPDPNSAIQSVDGIIFGYRGGTDKTAAVGTCRFTNPYRGTRSTITCHAEVRGGLFEASFTSDGGKPQPMH